MPFASVVHVRLGDDPARAEELLREQIIPKLKTHAGFKGGAFFRTPDGSGGMGLVLYDTVEDAEAGQTAMLNERPPEAPPVTGSAIYELIVEVHQGS